MKLTDSQLRAIAAKYDIEFAALKAVVVVEAAGAGFIDGKPKILFEPHVFYKRLGEAGYVSLRQKMQAAAPTLIYSKWRTYPYGKTSEQHDRLERAIKSLNTALPNLDPKSPDDKKILDDVRAAALESCSWGMGQVMGYHWQALGYDSLQDFVNAMYRDEASQVDAMMRFIAKNGLAKHLKAKNWRAFAQGYNGAGYAKNNYHHKLANAYKKYQ